MRRLFGAVWLRIRACAALAGARSASCRRVSRSTPRRVLVVCYGNIYRSPFVGAFLREHLHPCVEVRSAGFHPVSGRPSPSRHVQLCQQYEVSLDQHRSTVITAADAAWADLIVLMDRHNWAGLLALGADMEKLVWLGGLLPGPIEIADPYTLNDEDAERVVARMHEAAGLLVRAISARKRMS